MKKIMFVFGTRPEAIKVCPVIREFLSRNDCRVVVCLTGQHREMTIPILDLFQIRPDYNLDVMKEAQSLIDLTSGVLEKIQEILKTEKPDMVLVHGDTSTAFAAALACFYLQIPVGHIEAGLRTYDIYSPYPEEFNRQAISLIARYHFAPTKQAEENLLKEGREASGIFVTGNTGIDVKLLEQNPRHVYSEVSPIEFNGTYSWVSVHRIVL